MSALVVAVTDSVFPNLDAAREIVSTVGAELLLAKAVTPEAILKVATTADAVLTTYAKVTAEMIQKMTRCRIISRFGIGVDNVDIATATSQGIVVTKVPDYCIDEVSDHAMALLLAIVRKIPFSNSMVQAGRWEMPAVVPIHRLRGRVLGLAGFGRIPQLVAPKAKVFGLRVVASDPYVPPSVFANAGDLRRIGEDFRLHFPALPTYAGDTSSVWRRCVQPDEARVLPGQHRTRTVGGRGGAGTRIGSRPVGRGSPGCHRKRAARGFAYIGPEQCNPDAPYGFLFGRVLARIADQGGRRSSSCPQR